MHWAGHFYEIPETLRYNPVLRARATKLAATERFHGKALEGGMRMDRFREVLASLVNGELELEEAYGLTEDRLGTRDSRHAWDRHWVFPRNWGQRLIRVHYSRIYNQAAMEWMVEHGVEFCDVPHSPFEHPNTRCTIELAGGRFPVKQLLDELYRCYRYGMCVGVTIPGHPYCTHVVTP